MPHGSDNRWRLIGSALERIPAPAVSGDANESYGRVRTNSEPASGKTKNLFHHGRHTWLGMVARDRSLHGSALRVAILIWQHINEKTGYAWPSIRYIVKELKLHRATVFRAIEDLESRGWLTRSRRAGKNGVNHYRIAFGQPSVAST